MVGASLGLIVLAPAFVGVAIAIKLESRGPVISLHRRLGVDGRIFRCYKFRSMRADPEVWLRSDPALYARYLASRFEVPEYADVGLTGVGRLLRRMSFDELPQLINVLKGDMSLFGPPALLPEELGAFGSGAAVYLSRKPGVLHIGRWSRVEYAGRSRPEAPRGLGMIDSRKALRLIGESIREIAILVLVFAPLDAYFQKERPPASELILIEIGALLFIGIGIIVESRK